MSFINSIATAVILAISKQEQPYHQKYSKNHIAKPSEGQAMVTKYNSTFLRPVISRDLSTLTENKKTIEKIFKELIDLNANGNDRPGKHVVEIKNKYTNKKITFEFVLVYPPNKNAEVHVDVLNEEGKKYPNGNINIPLDEISNNQEHYVEEFSKLLLEAENSENFKIEFNRYSQDYTGGMWAIGAGAFVSAVAMGLCIRKSCSSPACLPYINPSSVVTGRVIELPLADVIPIAEAATKDTDASLPEAQSVNQSRVTYGETKTK